MSKKHLFNCDVCPSFTSYLVEFGLTRSSADADNRRDAFRGQSSSTNMVPFWVCCDFSLSMWPPPRVTRVYATDTSLSF